ncbi:ABC transporter substrate-binding protein [Paenibacillus harenae]|uniref:ABC-type glycerol-3-phosphate transport system substrate-binding protein n=1 Tax=Paenibacillus harenae TaxID=306543 RepID=A0ABT9U778_PAEHA|nr:extracellular solute-binding protein [Paenibacillus harenae]MDQ0115502.1 ABC-type glycerol-3-phosphate transport system substrate-binding protein [Paenibacillus harenae]
MTYRKMIMILIITALMAGCTNANVSDKEMNIHEEERTSLTVQLVSFNGTRYGIEHHRLAQKIERFRALNPHADIMIRWVQGYNLASNDEPSWIRSAEPADLYSNAENVPDIVELVPNQMLELYRRGIIEPLNMKETAASEYAIVSNDGYVLGIKSKINTMVVYYNKLTFESLGLEAPSAVWDFEQLNRTIDKHKTAGETVYIPLNPYKLEWAASLNGGRIAALDGVTYRGFLDSDETVKGAEWLARIGTKYKINIVHETVLPQMPYDLIDGDVALAVDHAYVDNINNYEVISQRNEQIGIAGLPVGETGVNPAQISDLSLTSRSKNKELAVKLLHDLMRDKESLYSDIADYTMQANVRPLEEPASDMRKALIIEEMKRFFPSALFMHETVGSYMPYFNQWGSPKPLAAIQNGQPIRKALSQYAADLEQE